MRFYRLPANFDVDLFSKMYALRQLDLLYFSKSSVEHMEEDTPPTSKTNKNKNVPVPELSSKEEIKAKRVHRFCLLLLDKLSGVNYVQNPNGIELYSSNLEHWYRDYNSVIKALIKIGVISRSKGYSNFELSECKKFKLQELYRRQFVEVELEKKKYDIETAIVRTRNYRPDTSITKNAVLQYQYDMFKNECDYAYPKYEDDNISITRSLEIEMCLTKFVQHVYQVKQTGKGNRVYSIMTSMPREGRKYIFHTEHGPFVGLDLTASHVTLLASIKADEIQADLEPLQKLIDGDFYASLVDGQMDRSVVKDLMKFYLYGSNYVHGHGRQFKKDTMVDLKMKEKLPHVHSYIKKLSKESKKKLSHLLMEVECDLLVLTVGEELIKRHIPFYTIHDCIYTTENHAAEVQKLIEIVFSGALNIKPRIKLSKN